MMKPISSLGATPDQFHALGESEAFLELQERIARAARTDRPVIFIGERGTGKELAARRLHLLSGRWSGPYVTLNCASLAPTLIESELFGHEAGAFTGAHRLRKGRFETAGGGSFFLDEIALLPATAQEKLLRVVEYGRLERVGSSETISVDVRLIAATNVDLRRLAAAGRFRQDLLDRLSFEVIVLPPLRRRTEDIPLLADHFARQMAHELGLEFVPTFSERARATLLAYPWPGNVRELKNVVERMVYRTAAPEIAEIEFDPFADVDRFVNGTTGGGLAAPTGTADAEGGEESGNGENQAGGGAETGEDVEADGGTRAEPPQGQAATGDCAPWDRLPLPEAVRALEVARLREALAACRFNRRRAAEHLGISYHQFRAYYRKYQQDLAS